MSAYRHGFQIPGLPQDLLNLKDMLDYFRDNNIILEYAWRATKGGMIKILIGDSPNTAGVKTRRRLSFTRAKHYKQAVHILERLQGDKQIQDFQCIDDRVIHVKHPYVLTEEDVRQQEVEELSEGEEDDIDQAIEQLDHSQHDQTASAVLDEPDDHNQLYYLEGHDYADDRDEHGEAITAAVAEAYQTPAKGILKGSSGA